MIIDCISDLHGFFPKLEGGDLLIIGGDLTSHDTHNQHEEFIEWILSQDYKRKIVIAGNHDKYIQKRELLVYNYAIDYLEDSGTDYQGLKIWGSPWSLWFDGINQSCTAFTGSENDLRKHYMMIPRDIDILITHCPPYGILDSVVRYSDDFNEQCGSITLQNMVLDGSYFPNLKLHVFGHIHEHGGKKIQTTLTTFVNASHVNQDYKPVNKPVRIIL